MPAKAAIAAHKPAAPKPRVMPAARPAANAVHPAARAPIAAAPVRAPALPAFARAALAESKSAAPAHAPALAHSPAPAASKAAAPAVATSHAGATTHAGTHKAGEARSAAPKPVVAQKVAHAPAAAPKPKLAVLPGQHHPGSPGQPLAPHIQEAIEHSFHVDVGAVRVHTSPEAQRAARELSARAFTYGSDIFLGSGEHPTDLDLMAHETAHVVQQQNVASNQQWSSDRNDRFEREADRAAEAVQHGQSFAVSERVTTPKVQRLGISDALDYFADAAYNIPGYRMFTILLGVNPINMEHVERNGPNLLRAIIEFLPGGHLITQALDKYNIINRVASWMSDQVDSLKITGSSIKNAIFDFLDSLSWRDIFHLGRVWDRAKRIFTEPIDRIIDFVKGLLEGIWKFVREAILKPIASLAAKTSGWDLLCAVMGKNPITGEAVERTPETLIGGFMKLIHQEEIWHNMQKANAVPRAMAWFKNVISELLGFVKQIPGLFIQVLKSLEWTDIIDLPSGFRKIVVPFGAFLGNFISWAGGKVWDLLTLIFEVVAPAVIPYLKKVGAAFRNILKNPIGFVRNLVAAAKLGLENFIKKFPAHLKAALIDWLTGSLPGVYIPKAFTLTEMGLFALSVLGITWAQIRGKIVKALGENGEKIMAGLETTFDVVVALVKGGPAAAWEVIKDKLTNLKDMVVDGIVSFVTDTIIKKAIPKLVSMFIPGAGFISAIISIYDSIMVFVQKLAKIIETVKAFVDSIVAIAAGQIEGAAAKVETSLANILSLAISFLAGFLGLSGIAAKVMGVIEKVRSTIDKALDTAVGWIVGKAKALVGSVKAGVKSLVQWWKRDARFNADGESHKLFFKGEAASSPLSVASEEMSLRDFLDQPKIQKLGKDETIKEIKALQTEIETARANRRPPTPDGVDPNWDPKIEANFVAIANKLPQLFTGDKWGTQTNPLLLLEYPKKSASLYRTIYLGPRVDGTMKQDLLKAAFGKAPGNKKGDALAEPIKPTKAALDDWIARGGKVQEYHPFDSKAWPDGGSYGGSGHLGVAAQFLTQVGSLFKYLKGSTPGGRVLNEALKKFGYYGRKEGGENTDGDHILEAQAHWERPGERSSKHVAAGQR